MAIGFAQALEQRVRAGFAPAIIGLDPRLDALPAELGGVDDPVERICAFYRESLPRLAPHVGVVKPNIAFFEQFGWSGFRAYESTCALAQELGMLVVGDIKRGDIGTTAAAYAAFHLRVADAVTLHPYLGSDSLEPFLSLSRTAGKGLFVLVRTSNPSAAEFQDLQVGEADLSTAVARAVDRWGEDTGDPDGYAQVGAVVGATWPGQIEHLRRCMPRAWLLLPGVGAQGATVSDVAAAFDPRGRGALVAQSRGVMQAFAPGDPDWRDRIAAAAAAFAAEVHTVAGTGQGER
ncbi:MAG: orotidine-5'-phosphate decarboxylase [Planctomycetes bacterium]|nr:orotidine-5'-phosphate decarboxylase [Planctomycetota bacterium]MCB9888150.1 orotidine-5'-phosphate decarboxylase [Planctomycetota bacterium]